MPLLDVLKACMNPGTPKTIKFTYLDSKGNKTEREAEPYEVKGDTLFAWCVTKNALRQFKLTSIAQPVVGKPFTPRSPVIHTLPPTIPQS